MERPLFTPGKFLNSVSENFKAIVRAFSIVLTISLIYTHSQAQVNCNTILACNDGIQISLDNDCNMTIEPSMMMQNPSYPADSFDVEAKLPNGNLLPQFTVGFDLRNRPIRRVAINRTHIGMNLQVKVSLRGCSNSCWGNAKIEDKLAPEISTCPCEQRITTFLGNVSDPDPDFDRPAECPLITSELGVSYRLHNFAVDVTGTVDISLPVTSVRFSLYATSFNPLSPCTNVIATNVNSFSGSLTVGTPYIMVVSSATSGIPLGGFDYTVYLDSRVGNVKSSVSALVCTLSCGGEVDLLAQNANNATNRPVFTDACSGAFWVPATTGSGTINFNSSSIVLAGGSSGLSTGVVTGAQICFTSPVSQNITFDWATSLLPNVSTDSAYYTVNGVPTVLSTSLTSGTNRSVFVPANGVFCFRVNTENVAPDNVLTITNIRTDVQSPALTYSKTDSVIILQCNEKYGKIVRRRWTATDPSGNVSDVKTQYIYVKRGSVEEVVCPSNWIVSCNVPYTKLPSGAPSPISSGQPSGIGCENMQVFYDDVIFDLCGAGVKVFRKWTIVDWCTGKDKICNQEIKVEDDILPAFTCPVLPNISTDSDKCSATWQVTPPSATDCSSMTWDVLFSKDSVAFVKADATTSISGTPPAFGAAISSTARPFTITGLPLGKTWIMYIVKDTCNLIRQCITSVTVVDLTAPTAICEDETIVSIDDLGWGVLKAPSLDNHSNDNCDKNLRFEVRRKTTTCSGYASDTIFKPEVRFCCADVTVPESYIPVVLRVYDSAGNYNECETTVKVQNKRPPTISCPSSKTLTCGDPKIAAWISGTSPFDTTFFGRPTTGGICSDLSVASRISNININTKCNTGTVTREWYIVSNPSIRCFQTLSIIAPVFNSSSVTPPSDLTLPICDLNKATPDFLNSKPIVSNLGCRDIGASSDDQIYRDVPGACIKILRTWRVIDWCSYSSTPYVWEHTQKILLTGTGGASFTGGCGNRTITADEGQCTKEVTLTVNPTDECTDEEDWVYFWTLDLYKDNVIDESGFTKSTTQTLPGGIHRVSFTVTNYCGTQSTCAYDITILTNKKPTPVCLGELVWVMDPTGSTEVWASDFIQSTSTNICGRIAEFDYYIFKQSNNNIVFSSQNRSITLNCGIDIPNGQVNRIPLKVYVRDRVSGAFDFCSVTLILQDSPLTNACPDVAELLPSVGGKITTENSEGIDNIEVALKNMNTSNEVRNMTQNHGEYKFTGVDVFDPKSIAAFKNNDILNGVSTLDLVIMQRHILGIQKIQSPFRLLAADVNNSKGISAGDLVALRKVILGVTNEFDNNTSWRFVPTSYVFSNPEYPFDFPEKVNFDSLFEDRANVNFTAVKIGDVNNSAVANIDGSTTEKRAGKALFTADQAEFNGGDIVRFEIKSGEDMEIMGAQFGLEFNADQLMFTGVKAGAFDIKAQHYNPFHISNGKISFSYDVAHGVGLKAEDVLFTVEFKANSAGNTSHIKLDQSSLSPEVYEMDANVRPLFVQNRDKKVLADQNILYQNEPNPFKDYTNISFELAKSSDVILRIVDITGKQVYSQKGKFEKGFNSIIINNSQLNNSGVYYYQIEAGEFSATKKMILIE